MLTPAEIGKRLRQARIIAKTSQQQLAEKIGVTQVEVSLWEKGKRSPQIKHALALIDIYGVHIFVQTEKNLRKK